MISALVPDPEPARSRQDGMAYAIDLILRTCRASPKPLYLRRLRANLARKGIKAAVATHDTPLRR